jgi:hypothetical protein
MLTFLQERLELPESLNENYSLFKHTGRGGYGDPFPYIRNGTIKRDREGYNNIYIPEKLLEQAQSAYEKCRKNLIKNCASL